MKNRRILGLGISGVAITLASIIFFSIVKPDNYKISVILGFCFLLFSYIVLFGGFIGLEFTKNSSQIILRVGCGITITGYSCLNAVTSLIYMLMNTESVKWFLLLQTVLFTIGIILSVTFLLLAGSIEEKDHVILHSVAGISAMADRLFLLSDNKKYGNQLKELAFDLKNTDVSSVTEADSKIEQMISNMETELAEDKYSDHIAELINSLALLINKRKIQVRNKKIGGI